MRNIFSTFIATILAAFFFSSAAMAQGKVMKDSEGNYFVQKMVMPPVDTGAVLEEGLNLTPRKLREVMNGDELVTKFTTSEVWGRYYLYRVRTIEVKEVVQLEGDVVKRVKTDKKEVLENFNPLLLLASLYVILMILSNLLMRRGSNAFVVAAAAFVVAVVVAGAAAGAAFVVAFVAAFVAFVAADAPPSEVKISNWATVIGVLAMALIMGILLAN